MLRAIDDPSRPRLAGGRAALVVLRRERPRHRGLRAVAAARCALGGADLERPAGRVALAPGARACSRSCTACARGSSVPALLERLYDETRDPGRAHRHAAAARRRSPTSRRSRRWRARPTELRRAHAARLRAPARGAHRARARGARPARPRGRATRTPCASCRSTRPRGWRRRSWRSTTPPTTSSADAGRDPALGRAARRDRLPQRLPAARLGRARPEGRRRAAGRRAPAAVRRVHARPRPAGGPRATRATRATGGFWRELIERAAGDRPRRDVRVVDAETLPLPEVERQPRRSARAGGRSRRRRRGGALGGASGAALIEAAAHRPLVPISATRVAARDRAAAGVRAPAARGGRDFGSLVHRILEWMPLEATSGAARAAAMARALAPAFGLDAEAAAARGATRCAGALGLPVMERARRAPRVWRELPALVPRGRRAGRGRRGPRVRGGGRPGGRRLQDRPHRRRAGLAQAAHHAPQLQLYGRGLAQATGMPVRERLVLFTALGRAVPV